MRTTVKLALLLLLGFPGAFAETVVGERAVVELRAVGTDYDKSGTYGAADGYASGAIALRPGQSGIRFVSAGQFDREGQASPVGFCFDASGAPQPNRTLEETKQWLLDRAPHVWWAEIRALPADIGTVSFEIDWEHWEATRKGHHRKVAGDRRTVILREGDRHVLDFVDASPQPETYCYRNLLIEVVGEVEEDPRYDALRFAYDVWFEHVDRGGRTERRRFQAVGRQGESVKATFEPLRFLVPGVVLSNGNSAESVLDLSAELQGRMRDDGRIDVRLSAGRRIGATERGAPRRGGNGDGGQVTMVVSPGEPVRLELPIPKSRNGVSIELGGRPIAFGPVEAVVDNAEFYAGSQDRLILTVRPVW